MPLYETTLVQRNQGETMINRWVYRAIGPGAGTASAQDCNLAMGFQGPFTGTEDLAPAGTIMNAMQAVQCPDVEYVQATTINLYDEDDFYIAPLGGLFGGSNGQSAPVFIAAGFRGVRTSRATRNAQKRIGGIPEQQIENDGNTAGVYTPEYLAVLQDVAAIFGTVQSGGVADYEFVTLSLKKVDEVVDGRTVRKYVKWPTEQEALENAYPVSKWEPYGRVRSQVSRQYFRGI